MPWIEVGRKFAIRQNDNGDARQTETWKNKEIWMTGVFIGRVLLQLFAATKSASGMPTLGVFPCHQVPYT